MKLISKLLVGVATVGMTCLVGYASAADSAPGDLISDSMLVADGTLAPGGRGGGTQGEVGRADKGTRSEHRLQGTPGHTTPGDTTPGKAKPRTEKDAGKEGNTRSESGKTGMSSESPGGSGSGAK